MRHLICLTLATLSFIGLQAARAAELNDPNSSTSKPANGAAVSPDAPPPTCDDLQDTRATYDSHTKKFKGCRVTSVKSGSGYDKMGLKTGDLVQPDSGQGAFNARGKSNGIRSAALSE